MRWSFQGDSKDLTLPLSRVDRLQKSHKKVTIRIFYFIFFSVNQAWNLPVFFSLVIFDDEVELVIHLDCASDCSK